MTSEVPTTAKCEFKILIILFFNYLLMPSSFLFPFIIFFYKNDFVSLLLVKHKAMATSMTSQFAATPNWSIYCFVFLELDLVIYCTVNLLNIITAKHKGSRSSSPQLH